MLYAVSIHCYSKKNYSKLAHCDCMRYLPVQVFLTQSVHKPLDSALVHCVIAASIGKTAKVLTSYFLMKHAIDCVA